MNYSNNNEYLTLNTGSKAPILGFGVYLIDPSETKQAVLTALESGYRSIDTAQYYRNEKQVGEAIRESGIPRKEVFVTTKAMTDGYDATKRGIDESLEQAGLDYFDMMLLHWPMKHSIDSYRALRDAYKEGKLRNIGISNFNINQTKEIMASTDVKPAVDQIETHIYLQQGKMHKFLTENDIVHESWSPLMEDARTNLTNPVLKKIGEKYDKNGIQVILRFLTQRNIMTIPRSTNPEHIKANIDIFDFKLTNEEMDEIRKLDRRQPIDGWPEEMRIDE